MTVDTQAIIEDVDRREREAGGYAFADHKQIIADTAAALGVPLEQVRRVMIDHWSAVGAG